MAARNPIIDEAFHRPGKRTAMRLASVLKLSTNRPHDLNASSQDRATLRGRFRLDLESFSGRL